MTHPDITFNVEGRSSCEAECLHVCIDNSLVHRVPLSPGALKLGDQLLIYWTPAKSEQLITGFTPNDWDLITGS